MTDDSRILEKIDALLRAGRLPARHPDNLWAAPGDGRSRCPICDAVMARDEAVIEAEFSGADGAKSLGFHAPCFWQLVSVWKER